MMSARPQVGIERLPARRMSNEPRESMNCKSCRKRKIKCNRLRPTCEACQVFQCPCIYDAIPKKRGPKTDVLEALVKRIDGLEKKLKDEKKSNSPTDESRNPKSQKTPPQVPNLHLDTAIAADESAIYSPTPVSQPSPAIHQDVLLLDTYFQRCHGNPHYILDEPLTRHRIQSKRIPSFLLQAIHAVSARYTPHPSGYHAAVRSSEDFALRARTELDLDDPSIDCLQALLLLTMAFTAAGKGKKAYMMLSSAIGMAVALELHRESETKHGHASVEKETRRRLFWTCYVMDRFSACGSKRPSLLGDESILVRLPSWSPNPGTISIEGEYFQNGSNLQYHGGSGKKCQGSSGMLIDIGRILGITNRYLAAGGVKGDSHFPWHSLSNLSKIRQELDIWASGTQEVFSSVDNLFGQSDSTTLVLSKLVYHLIHCLIYRPFLPIDLAELSGSGQHQSWQIEATNLCFLHANAIAELVELGKQSPAVEWPAFVGYCICTAGTVHVHGSHYRSGSYEGEVFSASADFLSREMQQLSELRYAWSSVQHQRETLQTIYNAHSELVSSLASNPARYSPVFHLEDFFDRYVELGQSFDGAHISFADILVDPTQDIYTSHGLYENHTTVPDLPPSSTTTSRPQIKRKPSSSVAARKKHVDLKIAHRNSHSEGLFHSPTALQPNSLPTPASDPRSQPHNPNIQDHSTPLHTYTPISQTLNLNLQRAPFSPPYSHTSLGASSEPYDPMFGVSQTYPYTNHNSSNHTPNHNHNGNGIGMGGQEGMTPGARSQGDSVGTAGTLEEKDPFLSLLEQLAENEHSRGGPSELDFFLGGGGG